MVQLVLHAHMPYVLNSPMEYWLHEAVLHSYLPLIRMLRNKPKARLVLHLSPILINQLAAPFFWEKFQSYGAVRKKRALSAQKAPRELIEKECARLDAYLSGENTILKDFSTLQSIGKIEILTGAASHAFLPLWRDTPWAERQIRIGQKISQFFFEDPAGFWFPECALDADLCRLAARHGLKFSYADPSCLPSEASPMIDYQGFRLFIRDRGLSSLIWDAETGYPASAAYRDFHADLSGEEGQNTGDRAGFSLRAVGDRTSPKKPYYQPEEAQKQAQKDAASFLRALPKDKPCTLAFDAELFGHWWHEGINFLENLFTEAEASLFALPRDLLKTEAPKREPKASTWGTNSDASSWLNPETAPLIESLFQAQGRLEQNPAAIRAFLLAQASDWPFLISHGSFVDDARHTVAGLLSSPPNDSDLLLSALSEDEACQSAKN